MATLDGTFIRCRFCACGTNAFVHSCCELGRVDSLGRLESELIARWEEDCVKWLPDANGHQLGDMLDTAGDVTALLAGRCLVLMDEVERLRELRNGIGELAKRSAACEAILKNPSNWSEWARNALKALKGGD